MLRETLDFSSEARVGFHLSPARFGAQANCDSTCHTKSAPNCTRIVQPIPARRYHTAQATPTNPLRETIQTQETGGTLWSPPKRNTAAGACKAPNSSELSTTAIIVLLPDTGTTRSKPLSKNSRNRISSPKEAVALARSAPQKEDGCNTPGRACGSSHFSDVSAPTRAIPQRMPVPTAKPACKPKRFRRFFVQMAVSSGAGSRPRARARRKPAKANKP